MIEDYFVDPPIIPSDNGPLSQNEVNTLLLITAANGTMDNFYQSLPRIPRTKLNEERREDVHTYQPPLEDQARRDVDSRNLIQGPSFDANIFSYNNQ